MVGIRGVARIRRKRVFGHKVPENFSTESHTSLFGALPHGTINIASSLA